MYGEHGREIRIAGFGKGGVDFLYVYIACVFFSIAVAFKIPNCVVKI